MNHPVTVSAPLLRAAALSYEINDRIIFQDLSLTLDVAEALHVEGENGAGKTVLLQLLCGLLRPDKGQVLWRNEAITEVPDYRRQLTYIGHRPGVKHELSVLDNLRFLTALAGAPRGGSDYAAALAWAGLADVTRRPAGQLSHGQRKRLALARLKLEASLLWILDEPFAGLDKRMMQSLNTLFTQHLEAGGALLLSSHQPLEPLGASDQRLCVRSVAQ